MTPIGLVITLIAHEGPASSVLSDMCTEGKPGDGSFLADGAGEGRVATGLHQPAVTTHLQRHAHCTLPLHHTAQNGPAKTYAALSSILLN